MIRPGDYPSVDEYERRKAKEAAVSSEREQIEREFESLQVPTIPKADAPRSEFAASDRAAEAVYRRRAELFEAYLNTLDETPKILIWALYEARDSMQDRADRARERVEHFEGRAGTGGDQ